ncbi:MAG: four helix bundle protein [Verrucomicrobiota bacterium]
MKNEPSSDPEIVGRTFRLGVDVVRYCNVLDQQPGVGRVLMSQIARSGTSVGANVEEAQAAESKADFISKMSIALKEARETNFRLRVLAAADIQRLVPPAALVDESDEIRRVLGAIVSSAKGTRLA